MADMPPSITRCLLDGGNVSYSPSDVVGRGGFGVVYRGFIDVKNFEDQSVAIKKINLTCYDEKTRDKEPMVNLKHENFVKIVKVIMDDEFRYLVMEMCIGTLAQVIDGSYKGPNLPSDVSVLRDIASGLHYIHTARFVHRNIKPENILISKDRRMKLSDLSFVDRIVYENCCWMAQELLEVLMIARTFGADNTKNIKLKVTPSCDVYSAGCVFFFFLTRGIGGVHPFGNEFSEQLCNMRKGEPVNIEKLDFGNFARATIEKMIAHNSRDRKSLPEVLEVLEKIQSAELDYSKHEIRSDSMFGNSVGSTVMNNEELLMNEEQHPPGNVKIKLENSEFDGGIATSEATQDPIMKTLTATQYIIEEHNYCMKIEPYTGIKFNCRSTNDVEVICLEDEPVNTQNLNCRTSNEKVSFLKHEPVESASLKFEGKKEEITHPESKRSPAAPKKELLADPKVEVKPETKTETKKPRKARETNKNKRCPCSFKQFTFTASPMKKVQFHPLLSDLLCCDSSDGVMTFQQHSADSLTLCNNTIFEGPEARRSKFHLKFNIDGTKLAASYDDGLIVIWDYPSCEIICRNPMPVWHPRLEWNKFNPHVFATYKWGTHSVYLVWVYDKCYSYEITASPQIRAIEWVAKDRIVIAYETGSLHLYYADGTKPPKILKKFKNKGIIKTMSWNEEYQVLATGSYNGLILIWKMDDSTAINRYEGNSRCHSLAWQPDNMKLKDEVGAPPMETEYTPTLVCGLDNKKVLVWTPLSIQDPYSPMNYLKHLAKVETVSFSPDGNYLAVYSFDNQIRVWYTKTWTTINLTSRKCREVSWNAASNKLAIVTNRSHNAIPDLQLEIVEIEHR